MPNAQEPCYPLIADLVQIYLNLEEKEIGHVIHPGKKKTRLKNDCPIYLPSEGILLRTKECPHGQRNDI